MTYKDPKVAKEKWRLYYQKNREKCLEKVRSYYKKNKESRCAYTREYYKNNKQQAINATKKWRARNKEGVRIYARKYTETHHKEAAAYVKNKKEVDVNFKLSVTLRNRIYTALKEGARAGSAVSDLGCTIPELKLHLEKQFKPGMTWDNWGRKGWHIDHKKPLDSFDLSDRNQLLQACHYTNLQPLWAHDNFVKSNKYNGA